MGGDYSKRASSKGKHVVVIGSEFTIESVMSFLSEFFEHPKLEVSADRLGLQNMN